MKNKKQLMVKALSTLSLVLMMGVFTQCMPSNKKQIGTSSSLSAPTPTAKPKDEGQIINETQVTEGMKNHEQIFHTMSALTGVPVTNNDVKNIYNQVATMLPTDNDIKAFLPPHQLAITKLASEFCNTLVENTAMREAVWPTYAGYMQNPDVGLSIANRDLIITEIMQSFWRGVISEADKQAAETELHQLIDDLLVDESLTTSLTTRNVVKGVCTSVLSSAHVTLI